MKGRVHKTLAMLLLCGLAGCASGPFHRKSVPPPALQPPPPELSQTPLYSPEMSDGAQNPQKLPNLPASQTPEVVKLPQPASQKPHKTHKTKPPVSTASNTSVPPVKAAPKEAGSTTTPPGTAAGGVTSTTSSATESTAGTTASGDKKAGDTQQASSGGTGLTAGDSAEAAQTSRQAEDLIKATKNGVEGIKRELTPDEKKTVVEIGTFLNRAQQALKNGDVDGAYGLATKAKLLLDELTQN
jgi:hypothetical protein